MTDSVTAAFSRVFPTGVGVNRLHAQHPAAQLGIPHRRGGEPEMAIQSEKDAIVFPTGVGVNRGESSSACPGPSVFPTGVGVNRRSTGRRVGPVAYSPQAWG